MCNPGRQAYILFLTVFLCGCDGCNNSRSVFGPPSGEGKRKTVMEAGQHGAVSIRELIDAYKRAHQNKDMKEFRRMLGWNVGLVNQDGTYPWYTRAGPHEVGMEKLFNMPIKDVEFVEAPPLDPRMGGEAGYYRADTQKGYLIAGNMRGKLLFVTPEGLRVDPSYIVLGYYGDRFVVNVSQPVIEDLIEANLQNRPQKWKGLDLLSLSRPENRFKVRFDKLRGK